MDEESEGEIVAKGLAVLIDETGPRSVATQLLTRFQAELRDAHPHRDAVAGDEGLAWMSQLKDEVVRLFVARLSRSPDERAAAVLWDVLRVVTRRLRQHQSAQTRRYRLESPGAQLEGDHDE